MDFTNTDNSINDLKRQKQALENAISVIRDKLLRAPEGSLRVSKYRDKNQFYIRNGAKDTNGRYIRQKDSFIAEQLAQKDYNAKHKTNSQITDIRLYPCHTAGTPFLIL